MAGVALLPFILYFASFSSTYGPCTIEATGRIDRDLGQGVNEARGGAFTLMPPGRECEAYAGPNQELVGIEIYPRPPAYLWSLLLCFRPFGFHGPGAVAGG